MTCPSPGNKFDQEIALTNGVYADAEAESDYGSDFTPDEEELLNELVVKVAGGTQGAIAGETAGTEVGALGGELGEEEVGGKSEGVVGVADIEDYERVWRGKGGSSYAPKVFGRGIWQGNSVGEVQQQRWRGAAAGGEWFS